LIIHNGLTDPTGISVFDSIIYVADATSVKVFSPTSNTSFEVTLLAGTDITADSENFIVVEDASNIGIYNTTNGSFVNNMTFAEVTGLYFDGTYFYVQGALGLFLLDTNFTVVTNYSTINATRTVLYNSSCFVSTSFDGTTAYLYSVINGTAVQQLSFGTFSTAKGITVVTIGTELHVLVADAKANTVFVFNATFQQTFFFSNISGQNFSSATALFTADGFVYITETNVSRITQFEIAFINITNSTHSSHSSTHNSSTNTSSHHSGSNATSSHHSSHHNSSTNTSSHHSPSSHHNGTNTTSSSHHGTSSHHKSSSIHESSVHSKPKPSLYTPTFIGIVTGSVAGGLLVIGAISCLICKKKEELSILELECLKIRIS